MFKKPVSKHDETPQRGQALVEFALSAPILVLLLLGLIDFGAILFSYSQASNSLREALRFAEILGYTGDPTKIPYLDCEGMRNAAENNFFTANHVVDITYQKASDSTDTKVCDPEKKDEINGWLVNGDILRIELTAEVDPFFIPIDKLDLEFSGQRSIVKALPITIEGGFGTGGDEGGDDDTGDDDTGGGIDGDGDGVDDSVDNCPTASNGDQADGDGDGVGDACDNCPADSNDTQGDTDGDGVGNACDNCPADANEDQLDTDGDGFGNVCDPDSQDDDEDGIPNGEDNCRYDANTDQADGDGDGVGDKCDNCPADANGNQADADGDGRGDVCDDDSAAPPAPQNFTAYDPGGLNCTGEVWFFWDAMAPIPTRMEIIDSQCDTDFSNDVVVEEMDDVPPSLVTNSFCQNCDSIDTTTGYKCYYAVAYNGVAPEYQGPDSNVSIVDCTKAPNAPINFDVQVDCGTGEVDFSWAYSGVQPTTVTIEQSDGTPVTTLPSASTTCDNCDTLLSGSQSWYIYATNGVPPNSKNSANSATVTRDCGAAAATGNISGSFFEAQNSNKECTVKNALAGGGVPVTLRSYPGASYIDDVTVSGSIFLFSNVDVGTYYLDVPSAIGSKGKVSDSSSGSCAAGAGTRLTITVTEGNTTSVEVGYY